MYALIYLFIFYSDPHPILTQPDADIFDWNLFKYSTHKNHELWGSVFLRYILFDFIAFVSLLNEFLYLFIF